MPSIHDLSDSKYLSRKDVEQDVLVTICGWSRELVESDGAKEDKYAIHFSELDKPLILNKTNGMIIAGITGSDDFDDWKGHQIVLYFDPNVSYGGRLVGGIRVRAPRNRQPVKPAVQFPNQQPNSAPAKSAGYDEDIPF